MTTTQIARLIERTQAKLTASLAIVNDTTTDFNDYWLIVATIANNEFVLMRDSRTDYNVSMQYVNNTPHRFTEEYAKEFVASSRGERGYEAWDEADAIEAITLREWHQRRVVECQQLIETIETMNKGSAL